MFQFSAQEFVASQISIEKVTFFRKFEDLQSSVAEAAEHNIVTEDVKKAEGTSSCWYRTIPSRELCVCEKAD